MIKTPTVLVIGAGASMPFGFPSGQILVDIITRYFYPAPYGLSIRNMPPWLDTGIGEIRQLMKRRFPPKTIGNFAEHLLGEESIDTFLEHQTGDFLEIGKALIAAVLLNFEREENLDARLINSRLESFFNPQGRRESVENNWYQFLWSALNAPFDMFEENKLKIITFNYDRSLEHYLFTRLKRRYPDKKNKD